MLSKGAEKIRQILTKAHIPYELEYVFNDLHSHKGAPLRFDFAIFKDNVLDSLIEYDSNLHFEYIPYIHKTKTNFTAAQCRDRIKNSYCLAHNIPLYRIPFWEIDNINTYQDLFNNKFRVKSRYHNDDFWRLVHKD